MRERRVPESPLGRALGFAGMGASLLFGSVKDSVVRTWSGPGAQAGATAGAPDGKPNPLACAWGLG